MDCVTFHLLTVFLSDAAETQCFYISNWLKKPNQVPIRQFVQRIQQLNSYLNLLPCLFYSKRATKLTKVVQAFDDVDLASHILQMVPGAGKTSTNSLSDLFRRAFGSSSKRWNASRRPIQLKRNERGLNQTQMEVVPPRKGWSLSATES